LQSGGIVLPIKQTLRIEELQKLTNRVLDELPHARPGPRGVRGCDRREARVIVTAQSRNTDALPYVTAQ
jgi:hypothetical protein